MAEVINFQDQEFQQQDPPKKRLYNKLYSDKKYSKSYEEFEKQFSTPEKVSKLHNALANDGLYSKTEDEFRKQYFGDVKKKVGFIDVGQSSLEAGNALSDGGSNGTISTTNEIPTIELFETDGDVIRTDDIVGLAKKSKELSQRTREQEILGNKTRTVVNIPDDSAIGESKRINKFLEDKGYNSKKISSDFTGIPEYVFNIPEFSKEELLRKYKENPQQYERNIASAKWQPAVRDELMKLPNGEELWRSVKSDIEVNDVGDINQQRQVVKGLVNKVKEATGDNEQVLHNMAVDLSDKYGKVASTPLAITDPKLVSLNSYQAAAYSYLEDFFPDEARRYKAAFLNPKDIEGNYEAELQRQEALKSLFQRGIDLSTNYAKENLNNLGKDFEYLSKKAEAGTITPEQGTQLLKIQEAATPFMEILQSAATERNRFKEMFPKSEILDTRTFAQELLGQQNTGLDWMALESGRATGNTVMGVVDLVKQPFLSDLENEINQAEILGSGKLYDYSTNLTQKNRIDQTFKPELSSQLQEDIDDIKNDNDLSYEEKQSKVSQLLLDRPNEWQRTPDSKTNLGLSSLMYGVGGLAANLAPFVVAEMATGGGASAGFARKFTSTFTAAAATGFHEAYRESLEKGDPNPFARAMRVTAINSAAMAGAQTPAAIRKMLGNKTAYGKMVSGLTDDEIMAALKESPKALRTLNNVLKNSKQVVGGAFKEGAKFSVLMQGAQAINDAADGELKPLSEYAKHAAIETLKFGLFGTALGAIGKITRPTDIQLANVMDAAKNKDAYISFLERMAKDGDISLKEATEVRKNIEDVSKIYENSPILKNDKINGKSQRQYLYNALVKKRALEEAKDLPAKQKVEAENKAMVADFKNSLILEPKTEKQLQSRKEQIEKELTPETKEDGSKVEVKESIKNELEAEREAIDEVMAEMKPKEEIVAIEQSDGIYEYEGGKYEITSNEVKDLKTGELMPVTFREDLMSKGKKLQTEIPFKYKTKEEIIKLPDIDRDLAIDDIIFGNEVNRDAFNRETGLAAKIGRYEMPDFLNKHEITGNEVAKDLLSKISKHPYFKNVKLYVTDMMPPKVKGEAIVTADIIKVAPDVTAETLSHEMMHTLTSMVFKRADNELTASEKKLRDGINGIIKQFDPKYEYLDKVLGVHGYKRSEYAQELIAEAFTGTEWAKNLNNNKVEVVSTRRVDKNLIQKIIDQIIKFFGGNISEYETYKDNKGVVDAVRDVFANHGAISSDRLSQLNKPINNMFTSNFSKEVDIPSAILRMKRAGFSEAEIRAEFEKRGLKYEEDKQKSHIISFDIGGNNKINVNLDKIEVKSDGKIDFDNDRHLNHFDIISDGIKLGYIETIKKGDDVKIAVSHIFGGKEMRQMRESEEGISKVIIRALRKIFITPFRGDVIVGSNTGKGIGKNAYRKLAEWLKTEHNKKLISDTTMSESARNLWESFEKNGEAKLVKDGNRNYYEFITKDPVTIGEKEISQPTIKEGEIPPIKGEPINEGGGVDKEKGALEEKSFDKMATEIPNGGKVKEYLSGDTIKKYEEGAELRNNQEIVAQELEPALRHGVDIVNKAKEIYGDDYVSKTLEYVEREKLNPENKALIYVSLENDLANRVKSEPNNLTLQKEQDLVRAKSQAFLRSSSLAINMGRLRRFAEVGYDVSKITDQFLSSKELETKSKIEKDLQADADTINKEAEVKEEKGGVSDFIEQKIQEGIQKELNSLYEKLPTKRRQAADRAIKVLEDIQKKLRGRAYDSTIGVPVAIIDAGITTIKNAIKIGVNIADAVELGIKKIKEKYGKEWEKEGVFRKDMIDELSKKGINDNVEFNPKKYVKEALIKEGFGRTINIRTKEGIEKREILDWKKLAGEEGSVNRIKENVEKSLSKDFSKEEITNLQKELIDEYNELRGNVVNRGLKEIADRNKTSVSPEQKSAAAKLVEMYNYGLFNKEPIEYENTLAKTIGVDNLKDGRFSQVKDLADAMTKLFSSSFQGKRLNEREMKSAIQVVEEKMRAILNAEAKSHGSTFLKIADIARTWMDATQRMTLNNLKQAVENPFSGLLESLYSSVSTGSFGMPKELASQRIKSAKDIYKNMFSEGGTTYGDVSSTFVNKGNLEMYANKIASNDKLSLSDRQARWFQRAASVVLGRATLDAVDSFYKSKITQQKFTYNLFKILTTDRIVNGKKEKGMSRQEAKEFLAEKLSGQTFKDAQSTAKTIIDKVNAGREKKILNDSQVFIDRLANDIVTASLVNGEKITPEMVTAAYNSAYKAAGRGLGHVANNIISKQVGNVTGELEKKINEAIKEKDYNKAAGLTLESIFFRNIANPFVGGGTNWVVLKLEKTGLGLLSGLGSLMKRGAKMDLTSDAGIKNLEEAMYENLKIKDKFIRGAIGGGTTALAALAWLGIASTDDYRKWRKKNPWASRYLDTITPEYILAAMAAKNGDMQKYLANTVNKNDAFNKETKLLNAANAAAKGDYVTAKGQSGEVIGNIFGAPIPWRLVRDGQQILQGATGGEVYKVNGAPSQSLLEGYFKGGLIDYLGYAPKHKQDDLPTLINRNIFFNPKEQEKIINNNRNGEPITDEEFEKYNESKRQIIEPLIKKLYTEGYPVIRDGVSTLIPYKELTQKEIEWATTSIKSYATKTVKEALFGVKEETDEEKEANKELQNLKKEWFPEPEGL